VLILNIHGNIIHDGYWLNWATNLVSSSDQEIMADSSFSGSSFSNTISSKNVNIPLNNLSFYNCAVDMGDCNVVFGNGMLDINYKYFSNAVIIAENLSLTLSSGAYLEEILYATQII